ncbi:MAG: cytochrome c biogenesis protein CcdA [Christensenellaceae bacterium]|jgi:cytochrome c-type biogenesis protein|nr:cytochrome c biogenesis protein CcdA [Christensenellaceae bacterium]
MQYILLFLEGVITFISPCLLPLLPIYVSYFAGGGGRVNALKNALGFVLGFTLVFVSLGAFAGSVGWLLREYAGALNIVTGLVVVLFGLNYLGALKIPFLNRTGRPKADVRDLGFASSVLFGLVFAIGWTPCVGAFLGSALMLASRAGSAARGILMLFTFSLGLGIPFVASAVLIERLKSVFDFIKRNYRVVNMISGGLLVVMGIMMMTGLMGYVLGLLSFYTNSN